MPAARDWEVRFARSKPLANEYTQLGRRPQVFFVISVRPPHERQWQYYDSGRRVRPFFCPVTTPPLPCAGPAASELLKRSVDRN